MAEATQPPSTPERPVDRIENCPITPAIQDGLYEIIKTLMPEKSDPNEPGHRMSQMLVMLRDGTLIALSALEENAAGGGLVPTAREYPVPVRIGTIQNTTAITSVAYIADGTNRKSAAFWYIDANGKRRCTSG